MKLIDEMREKAESFRETSPYDYGYIADQIRDWADRLERATILVAVPHGEACDILAAKSQYVTDEDGELWECHPEPADDGCEVRSVLTGCGGYFADTIVQPVALVPITEAEV